MLRALALAIPDGGSQTFFGDIAQQIYRRGTPRRSAGQSITARWGFMYTGRSWSNTL